MDSNNYLDIDHFNVQACISCPLIRLSLPSVPMTRINDDQPPDHDTGGAVLAQQVYTYAHGPKATCVAVQCVYSTLSWV